MNDNLKQDINFLEKPIWLQNQKTIKDKVTRWNDKEGYEFVCIGTPTKVDILILYFLLRECQLNDWENIISVSKYQILNGCGMNPGQKERVRLRESLDKWQSTNIKFQGTFYDGRTYVDMGFHLLKWKQEIKTKKIIITMDSDWIEKIKQSEFFKYVSFEQIKKLRSPLALRLYEILIKNFYKRVKWEIDVLKLAAKVPMEKKYFSDIVPRVKAAVKRISDKTELNIEVEVVKQGRGKGKFIFRKFAKKKLQPQILPRPKEADILPEIPGEFLDMIPLADQARCMNICQKIFTDDGADGLRFYLEKTNNRKQNGKSSYSGYLKTVFDLNLYADHLATKQALEDQIRAEQIKLQEELKKQQEDDKIHQLRQMQEEALTQLKQNHPEKYQQLYDQAVLELGINPDHPKRGDTVKIKFEIMKGMV